MGGEQRRVAVAGRSFRALFWIAAMQLKALRRCSISPPWRPLELQRHRCARSRSSYDPEASGLRFGGALIVESEHSGGADHSIDTEIILALKDLTAIFRSPLE